MMSPVSGELVVHLRIDSSNTAKGRIFWSAGDAEFTEEASKAFNIADYEKDYYIGIKCDAPIENLRIVIGDEDSIGNEYEIITQPYAYAVTKESAIAAADRLSAEHLNITAFSDNHLSGTINVSDRKLIFLPIPYNDGWQLKINGQETPVMNLNIGFMGAILEPGSCEIELEFTPPLSRAGNALSLGALVFLVVYALVKLKRAKTNKAK